MSCPKDGERQIPARFLRCRFSLSSSEEDWFAAEMWSLGTLGIESARGRGDRIRATVYFPRLSRTQTRDLLYSLHRVPGRGYLAIDEIEAQDWLAPWRLRSRPFPLGRDWMVDPREPAESIHGSSGERRVLRIPARSAFGTGSHESTRLAVELAEGVRLDGCRVLDVGTGTGILGMIALDRGAGFVVGVDIDPIATFHARENGRLNGLQFSLVACRLSAFRRRPGSRGFDVALVNVLPVSIWPDMADLLDCMQPQAEILLSGLQSEQENEMIRELAALRLRVIRARGSGEWLALHLERVSP